MGLASGQVAKGNTWAVPQEGCWAGSSLRMTGMLCMTREGGALLQATLKNTALRGCYFQIPISPLSVIARTDLGVHTHPSPYSPGLTFRASGPPLSYQIPTSGLHEALPLPSPHPSLKMPQEPGSSGYSHLHPSWFAPGPQP